MHLNVNWQRLYFILFSSLSYPIGLHLSTTHFDFHSVIILKLLLPSNMAACGYGADVRKIDWDVYLYRYVYLSIMKALFRILTVYQNNMKSLLNMQIPRLCQDHVQNGEKKSRNLHFLKNLFKWHQHSFKKIHKVN